MRWTTGIGIAVGGVGGAIAALLGAPKSLAPQPPTPAISSVPGPDSAAPAAAVPPPEVSATAVAVAVASASVPAASSAETAASTVVPAASSAETAAAAPLAAASSPANVIAPPALDIPASRDALLRAEMLCDQRKDFDACARAALALDTGSTGPADPEQAKRFRRIALTHLVAQCESDSAHACFVLAAKYRAGTELASKPASAEALEKRGAELCRLGRSAPECPTP